MNEQVEEIKTEIKRRLDVLQYQAHRGDARKELRRLLSFIDTLPENAPNSVGLEEAVSEDLEKEIIRWEDSFKHNPASMGYKETARHFANWQKQQMMKDAVDGTLDMMSFPLHMWVELSRPIDGGKDGDKVKIITVKEDKH